MMVRVVGVKTCVRRGHRKFLNGSSCAAGVTHSPFVRWLKFLVRCGSELKKGNVQSIWKLKTPGLV